MNILFVHQNFPGQFKHLAPAMARQGHRVVALHINACPSMPGVELVRYPLTGRPGQGTHRWLADLETKTLRGEAAWAFIANFSTSAKAQTWALTRSSATLTQTTPAACR